MRTKKHASIMRKKCIPFCKTYYLFYKMHFDTEKRGHNPRIDVLIQRIIGIMFCYSKYQIVWVVVEKALKLRLAGGFCGGLTAGSICGLAHADWVNLLFKFHFHTHQAVARIFVRQTTPFKCAVPSGALRSVQISVAPPRVRK